MLPLTGQAYMACSLLLLIQGQARQTPERSLSWASSAACAMSAAYAVCRGMCNP